MTGDKMLARIMKRNRKPLSFAPMFEFPGGEVQGNAQRFATRMEAEKSAAARFASWTMPTGYHVVESFDPINYRYSYQDGDVSIKAPTS